MDLSNTEHPSGDPPTFLLWRLAAEKEPVAHYPANWLAPYHTVVNDYYTFLKFQTTES